MSQSTLQMRSFAERLIAIEAKGNNSGGENSSGCQVCEKLRPHFAMLMGAAGFRALLSRALVLANSEVAWLRAVHIKSDGSLEGLDELKAKLSSEQILEGRVALLAQLLGLLVAFIGQDLTVRLVQEVWPKVPFDHSVRGKGGRNEKSK